MRRFKNIYKALLESEDLYHVFEGMTGVWAEDKESFIDQQKALEELGNTKNIYD